MTPPSEPEPVPSPASAAESAHDRLAIDGGPKTHRDGWPAWPKPTPADEEAVLAVLRAGTWCSAAQGAAPVRRFEEAFAALHTPPPDAPASPLDPAPLPASAHASPRSEPTAATAASLPPLDCVAVSSGTDALTIALEAAGVGPGDDVIVPPYTFIATASACAFLGAIPVFADLDPRTLCLDPAAVAAAWTPRTKAVVPVHLGGCPADLSALAALCRDRGAALVEDACQAPGAAWAGRPVGSWGTFGCFSFQESKNLSAGEGGAITGRGTPIEIARSVHNVGRTRGGAWYGHERLGGNHRMTAFQAALLRSQLGRFQEQSCRRIAAAFRLSLLASAVPGIQPLSPPAEVTRHAWHLFIFRYSASAFGGHSRGEFLKALSAEGIPASSGYVLLTENAALHRRAKANAALAGVPDPVFDSARVPVARAASEECCWLSQNVLLADDEGIEAVAAAMAKIQRAWGR